MKNKLNNWLIAVFLGLSFLAVSGVAEAYCKWVPTHWQNGYRASGHQVCKKSQVRCKTVPGYWRNGYWHKAHKTCWRVY